MQPYQEHIENRIGLGLEIEGYILQMPEGKPVATIEDIPTAEWILNKVEQLYPLARENLSTEELSVMLEVKSGVNSDFEDTAKEIFGIRELINQNILPHGTELRFIPVVDKPFDLLPPTRDPKSRSYQLYQDWSKTPEGKKLLADTAIASTQINDSRPFANTTTLEEKLEKARLIMNFLSANFDKLNQANNGQVDNHGRTRLEKYRHLITTVRRNNFEPYFEAKGNHNPEEIIIPPQFPSVEAMIEWWSYHKGKPGAKLEELDPKGEYAFTAKIKRWLANIDRTTNGQNGNGENGDLITDHPLIQKPWVLEVRTFEAKDSIEEVRKLYELYNRMMNEASLI